MRNEEWKEGRMEGRENGRKVTVGLSITNYCRNTRRGHQAVDAGNDFCPNKNRER
jgi:hypothetical protein